MPPGSLFQGEARATSISAWIGEERTTKPSDKMAAAQRVALLLASGVVAPRSQLHWQELFPGRASPEARSNATNCLLSRTLLSKCDGFSIIDTTEIRTFKIPTRPKIPTKSIILLQMSILRRIHRLGTNPD